MVDSEARSDTLVVNTDSEISDTITPPSHDRLWLLALLEKMERARILDLNKENIVPTYHNDPTWIDNAGGRGAFDEAGYIRAEYLRAVVAESDDDDDEDEDEYEDEYDTDEEEEEDEPPPTPPPPTMESINVQSLLETYSRLEFAPSFRAFDAPFRRRLAATRFFDEESDNASLPDLVPRGYVSEDSEEGGEEEEREAERETEEQESVESVENGGSVESEVSEEAGESGEEESLQEGSSVQDEEENWDDESWSSLPELVPINTQRDFLPRLVMPPPRLFLPPPLSRPPPYSRPPAYFFEPATPQTRPTRPVFTNINR